MSSSQPRIAKAENGDNSVSIELLIRAMLATGATPQDIGQVIAGGRVRRSPNHSQKIQQDRPINHQNAIATNLNFKWLR